MAYGNWGAFVYKNGERQKDREDNTPFMEDELDPGYHQAFGRNDLINPHHAVLGGGLFRLCGYKSYPVLYWDKEKVTLTPYQKGENAGTEKWDWHESEGIEGELNGYKFKATPDTDPESVILKVTDPDGTIWESKCGYCIGAGHEE